MGLTDTPSANRLQIGLYGRRNSGKSSLLNALTGQEVSLVSEVAGTTTDPVAKAMEWHPLGPVLFYDTAGFDDEGELGAQRGGADGKNAGKEDVACWYLQGGYSGGDGFCRRLKEKHIPTVAVLNQTDLLSDEERDERLARIGKATGLKPVAVSARERRGMEQVREALIRAVPEDFGARSIVGGLAGPGDTVLLVMPQDIQAPKGRLILPPGPDHSGAAGQGLCGGVLHGGSDGKGVGLPGSAAASDRHRFPVLPPGVPAQAGGKPADLLFGAVCRL